MSQLNTLAEYEMEATYRSYEPEISFNYTGNPTCELICNPETHPEKLFCDCTLEKVDNMTHFFQMGNINQWLEDNDCHKTEEGILDNKSITQMRLLYRTFDWVSRCDGPDS